MTTETPDVPTVQEAKAWWEDNFPARYYAFSSDSTWGGYPVAGLADLNVYSSQPGWLTSSTQLVALTQAEWLSVPTGNLIIKDGKVQTYTAPTETVETTATSSPAS